MSEPRNHLQMEAARKRDGDKCRKCDTPGPGLDVHHIDGNPSNNELSNLITLCPTCHPEGMDAAEFWFWLDTWPTWKEVMQELFRRSMANGNSVSRDDFEQALSMDAVHKAWHGWQGDIYRKRCGGTSC